MSIPTSLIFVILIAAWLAVLVPMVARRREQVPEAETDGGTFRVLRPDSVRRRPKLWRREELEGDDLMETDERDESDGEEAALDEELLDSDEMDDDEFDSDEFDTDEFDSMEAAPVEAVVVRPSVTSKVDYDAVETAHPDPTFRPGAPVYQTASATSDRYQDHEVDDARLRPVPRRSGRGGYDPDAAEIARRYRYSRRRRVTVVLLIATIAFSLAAYFVKPVLWAGTAVFGLLLIAYLGYLRRQVHIEADIRERRLARLARARQIRPEYAAVHSEMAMPTAPFAAATAQVPPSGYRNGRQIVDLEDDDPSFDDLEYYQPVTYRRASGQ